VFQLRRQPQKAEGTSSRRAGRGASVPRSIVTRDPGSRVAEGIAQIAQDQRQDIDGQRECLPCFDS
jgi:hypothetical protein